MKGLFDILQVLNSTLSATWNGEKHLQEWLLFHFRCDVVHGSKHSPKCCIILLRYEEYFQWYYSIIYHCRGGASRGYLILVGSHDGWDLVRFAFTAVGTVLPDEKMKVALGWRIHVISTGFVVFNPRLVLRSQLDVRLHRSKELSGAASVFSASQPSRRPCALDGLGQLMDEELNP